MLHADFEAEGDGAVGVVSCFHAVPLFLDGGDGFFAFWVVSHGAAVCRHLLGCLCAGVGVACFDEFVCVGVVGFHRVRNEYGLGRGDVEVVEDVSGDGVDVFLCFFFWVGVVKA